MATQTEKFAEACYDMNTLDELNAALRDAADAADCREWGITPTEWRIVIERVIEMKRDGT